VLIGGVGLAGFGGFAVFGLTGLSEKRDLADTCAPSGSCAAGDVSSARTRLIIADVSLGVGVVAVGIATYLFLRDRGAPFSAR
jgi:hypothetical protein